MILTPEEKRAALQSLREVLFAPEFDISHIDIARPQREVERSGAGVKYVDPGVVIVSIVGLMPPDEEPSWGPVISEDVAAEEFLVVTDEGDGWVQGEPA